MLATAADRESARSIEQQNEQQAEGRGSRQARQGGRRALAAGRPSWRHPQGRGEAVWAALSLSARKAAARALRPDITLMLDGHRAAPVRCADHPVAGRAGLRLTSCSAVATGKARGAGRELPARVPGPGARTGCALRLPLMRARRPPATHDRDLRQIRPRLSRGWISLDDCRKAAPAPVRRSWSKPHGRAFEQD